MQKWNCQIKIKWWKSLILKKNIMIKNKMNKKKLLWFYLQMNKWIQEINQSCWNNMSFIVINDKWSDIYV